VSGFVVLLVGALLWKLGLIGGDGGPLPTAGGSETRPTPAGIAPDPTTRRADSRAAAAPAPRFRIVARVVTRDAEPRPQLGRKVGLYEGSGTKAGAVGLTGLDGVARLDCPADWEPMLLRGELALLFEDRPEAGARGVPPPRRLPASLPTDRPFDIEVGMDDDPLSPPATAEAPTPATPETAASRRESRPASAPDEGATIGDGTPLSGPGVISGRLLFRDGKPVPRKALRLQVYRPLGASGGPENALQIATDAAGRFSVSVDPGTSILAELRASTGGGDAAAPFVARADQLDAAHPLSFGDLTLARETAIVAGIVVDAAGKPVRNAVIAVRPEGAEGDALGARTDENGVFSVVGPEECDRFEVFAETEDAAGRSGGGLRRGRTGLRLVLEPAARLVGRVETPSASLLPLVEVALWTKEDVRVATVRPRRDGTFRFVHVAAGEYRIVASLPSGKPVLAGVVGKAGEETAPASPLAPASEYRVRRVQVREESGKPLSGAQVTARWGGPTGATITVESGADGAAELWLPPGAAASLSVTLQGFVARELEPVGGVDTDVVLRRG
jgi:hypothetical protein